MIAESNTYLDIARKELAQFEKDNENYVEFLILNRARRSVMFGVYRALVDQGIIPEIRLLSEERQTVLWEGAKELSAGRLSNDECIMLSKALYVLHAINQ
jgi:hypothetical protein